MVNIELLKIALGPANEEVWGKMDNDLVTLKRGETL